MMLLSDPYPKKALHLSLFSYVLQTLNLFEILSPYLIFCHKILPM